MAGKYEPSSRICRRGIQSGLVREEKGFNGNDALQTAVLLDALERGKYDAAMGGAQETKKS